MAHSWKLGCMGGDQKAGVILPPENRTVHSPTVPPASSGTVSGIQVRLSPLQVAVLQWAPNRSVEEIEKFANVLSKVGQEEGKTSQIKLDSYAKLFFCAFMLFAGMILVFYNQQSLGAALIGAALAPIAPKAFAPAGGGGRR